MGDPDCWKRRRTAIGPDGKLVPVPNLPNNRIVDNQYAKHVDQKANYLLGRPITFDCENTGYAQKIKKILGKQFMRVLKNAGVECFNAGISWLYPYYNKNGELAFRLFPGHEILPFGSDAAHTELDSAVRLYPVEVYAGPEKKIVMKADIFTLEGVRTYIFENGALSPDPDAAEKQSYVTADGKPLNWERFPLIPVKYNAKEIPLIRRGRGLQDAINLLQSDFVNAMESDAGNTVLVLRNYDGQDLGEFRKNLATYRAIKVRSFEGKDNQQPLWDAMGELLGDKIKAVHFKGKNFAPDGTMLHTSLEDSCTDYAGAFAMLRTLPQPLPVLREEAVPARAASDIAFIKQFF